MPDAPEHPFPYLEDRIEALIEGAKRRLQDPDGWLVRGDAEEAFTRQYARATRGIADRLEAVLSEEERRTLDCLLSSVDQLLEDRRKAKDLRGRVARAHLIYAEREKGKRCLGLIAESFGWKSKAEARGAQFDILEVATSYDLLVGDGPLSEGALCAFIEDPIRFEFGELPAYEKARDLMEAAVLSKGPVEPYWELFKGRKCPSWFVTGLPFPPAIAIAALREIYQFASNSVCIRHLEKFRSLRSSIAMELNPYAIDTGVAQFLYELPHVNNLSQARRAES